MSPMDARSAERVLGEFIRIMRASPQRLPLESDRGSVEEVCVDIERMIGELRSGTLPSTWRRHMETLIAPTGELQDISIRNGWGERFIELADELEVAVSHPEQE